MTASNPQNGVSAHINTEMQPKNSILPLFNLTGKTAIVSGAAAGIGLAAAQALAEAGANVAILYHNSVETAPKSALDIEQTYSVRCKAYKVDVTVQSSVDSVVDQIVHDFNGRLDIFIANSGIPWLEGSVLDGSNTHYRNVMATNLDGTFYCAVAAGRYWRRQAQEILTGAAGDKLEGFQKGSFVVTGSIMARVVGRPQMQAPYNIAKAGVVHLCKSLAVEWADFARANSVSPGYTATEVMQHVPDEMLDVWKDMTAMRRLGRPEEMKGAFLYLASDASSFTTGADIVVDGGFCLT